MIGLLFMYLQNNPVNVPSSTRSLLRKKASIPVATDTAQEMAIMIAKPMRTASVMGTRILNGSNGSWGGIGCSFSSKALTCTRGLVFRLVFAFVSLFRRVISISSSIIEAETQDETEVKINNKARKISPTFAIASSEVSYNYKNVITMRSNKDLPDMI